MGKKSEEKEPKYIMSLLNNRMLNYRAYYMSFGEIISYFLLVFVIGGIVGLVFYGGLFKEDGEATMATSISNAVVFCVVGVLAARIFLPAIKNNLMEKRNRKLQKQFMDLLETLATSLASGNTLNGAFVNARQDLLSQYSEGDMIVREISEIVLGMENGLTIEELLLAFGKRSGNEDIENFSNVISNCYRLGGDFKSVVRKTRNIIGDKIAIANEIDTKLTSNKLQHNAMSIMPIVLIAMIKFTNASMAKNLTTVLGVLVTTIAVAIFVGSYFWGKRIINIG